MYSSLLTDLDGGILTVTVNRPDKLNAINKTVMKELGEVVDEVYANAMIKSVILTGAGQKAFVAGADITEFLGLNVLEGGILAKIGQDIFMKIENSPKPFVAAVNGFALGGGCELAMACHFRICSENARFGQPEVNLGLIPGYGGTQRLTQLVGKGKAMELMMTGNIIDAQEALQWRLVNYVTSQDTLLSKTREILQLIQAKAPVAISKIIECVNVAVLSDSAYTNGKSGYEKEQQAFGECFGTEDMKEGAQAFVEKRKPLFKGR